MTQTAVEWLIKELNLEGYDHTIQQAKEMEKQQIIDAHDMGYIDGGNHKKVTAEMYYNETYGSKGSDETLKEYHIVDTNEMVELPQQEISDEEIEKAARDYDNSVIYGPPLLHFEQGAFWHREQIKNRSNG